MKKITLDFDGYWREANKDSIPRQSGIYCVYTVDLYLKLTQF